ncbi:MAG: J domain-containing protein [Bdellovibrionota bacterium]
MIREFLVRIIGVPGAAVLYILMAVVGVVIISALLWLLRIGKTRESMFSLREADRPRFSRKNGSTKHKTRLFLEGMRTQGAPHEILGVSPHATDEQIQKAYRTLMKRYHPDRVGKSVSPESQEWKEIQRIAEIINKAKDQLLKRR